MKDFIKKNWKNILLILLVIIVLVLIFSTKCVRDNNKNLQYNIKALTDSVQTLELKNGSLLYEKQSLILEKDELEKYLGISKKEIKELEKKLETEIALAAKVKTEIIIDTLLMKDSIYISNDTTKLVFIYKDQWVTVDGESMMIKDWSKTQINNLSMIAPLTVGLTNDYKVYVVSENPYLKISDIDAAVIENSIANQKPKRWGIGPYVGVGIGTGTDFKGNSCFGWSVSAGFCVTYSLFQW